MPKIELFSEEELLQNIPPWVRTIADSERSYDPFVEYVELPPLLNAVFEGAGVKGIAYAGAIKYLEEVGLLQRLQSVGGSSAGGIASCLLALGYNSEEIENLLSNTDIKQFLDEEDASWWHPKKIIHNLKRLQSLVTDDTHGYSSGKKFMKWIEDKIAQKLGDPNATFRDLHNAMKTNPNLKDLKVTGTNLTQQRLQIFDFNHTPDMRIADAIRVTMSFPGAFAAHKVPDGRGGYDIIADGGIASNFPLHIYNKRENLGVGFDFTDEGANPCTVGFLIDNRKEMRTKLWNDYSRTKPIDGITGYLKSILSGLSIDYQAERQGLQIVQIFDKGIETLDFDLDSQAKRKLFNAGYKATKKWIEQYRNGTAYHMKHYDSLEDKYASRSINELKAITRGLEQAYAILLKHKNEQPNNPKIQLREEQILSELAYLKFQLNMPILGPAASKLKGKKPRFNSEKGENLKSKSVELISIETDLEKIEAEHPDIVELEYTSRAIVRHCEENIRNIDLLISKSIQLMIHLRLDKTRYKDNIECLEAVLCSAERVIEAQNLYSSAQSTEYINEIENAKKDLINFIGRKNQDAATSKILLRRFDRMLKIINDKELKPEEKSKKLKIITQEIKSNIDRSQIHISAYNDQLANSQRYIAELREKKYQSISLLNVYQTAPAAVPLIRNLQTLDLHLTRFIQAKSNILLSFIDKFGKLCNISDTYLPANVVLLRKANLMKKDIENLKDEIRKNSSLEKIMGHKQNIFKNFFQHYVEISGTKTLFWKSSRERLIKNIEDTVEPINHLPKRKT